MIRIVAGKTPEQIEALQAKYAEMNDGASLTTDSRGSRTFRRT